MTKSNKDQIEKYYFTVLQRHVNKVAVLDELYILWYFPHDNVRTRPGIAVDDEA